MSQLTLLNLSRPETVKAAANPTVIGLEDAGQYFDIFRDTKTSSGKAVTYEQAMRCSGVLTCIRNLSEDIASLRLVTKLKKATGAVDATSHPAWKLLNSAPNAFQTSFELREHMMLDMLLTGYFYNWQQRNGVGRLTAIVPIPAQSIHFSHETSDGTLLFNCGAPNLPTQFSHYELWRGTILNHSIIGARSLIMLAREAIGLALAAEEQGARLFSQGVQSDFVLQTDGVELGDVAIKQMREAFAEQHSGSRNSWKPMILEGGLKASRIGLTAQESQYMDSRNFQLSDIARLFRMPGVMLGLSDKTNTFAAAEQFFGAYTKFTLGPWCRRIEETAERDLLLPRESDYFIRHDYSQLLKADQKTRFDSYKTAILGGFMQPQEARVAEDWEEIEGLDFNLVPANYAIVRDGQLEAVPTSNDAAGVAEEQEVDGEKLPATPAVPPPNPAPTTAKPPANPAKSADQLAIRAAKGLVTSEQRQFARMRVSEAALAGFAAWHMEKIMEVTGVDSAAAQDYSTWRLDNRNADEEAVSRLSNLCLEAIN